MTQLQRALITNSKDSTSVPRDPQEVKEELADALRKVGIEVETHDVQLVLNACRRRYFEEMWGPLVWLPVLTKQ